MRRVFGAGVVGLAIFTHLSASADSAGGRLAKGQNSPSSMNTAPLKANGSGIVVQFRLEAEAPEVGKVVPVVLTFDGISDPTGAALRVSVDGGLALVAPNLPGTLPPGRTSTLTLEVVPGAQGVGYLHVFTTQYGSTTATSIPVQVGKAASKLPVNGNVKQAPSGDKILPMPVR